jgi:hypothetical protein
MRITTHAHSRHGCIATAAHCDILGVYKLHQTYENKRVPEYHSVCIIRISVTYICIDCGNVEICLQSRGLVENLKLFET